jgi:hypothetical protein
MLKAPGFPKFITGVSENPLGLYIFEDPIIDGGISLFDARKYFERNIRATLDDYRVRVFSPFPGAAEIQCVFGHTFDPSDVERIYLDDKLIWIPRECRNPGDKNYIDLLEKGIIRIELLDYPQIVDFIQKNREKLFRLGLKFDK